MVAIVTRVLLIILLAYVFSLMIQRFLKKGTPPAPRHEAKREKTDYDKAEWDRLRKSLEEDSSSENEKK